MYFFDKYTIGLFIYLFITLFIYPFSSLFLNQYVFTVRYESLSLENKYNSSIQDLKYGKRRRTKSIWFVLMTT